MDGLVNTSRCSCNSAFYEFPESDCALCSRSLRSSSDMHSTKRDSYRVYNVDELVQNEDVGYIFTAILMHRVNGVGIDSEQPSMDLINSDGTRPANGGIISPMLTIGSCWARPTCCRCALLSFSCMCVVYLHWPFSIRVKYQLWMYHMYRFVFGSESSLYMHTEVLRPRAGQERNRLPLLCITRTSSDLCVSLSESPYHLVQVSFAFEQVVQV
ncbi:hypothetical protein OG21DRAFT_221064 [Imleria badia]|nr:hypothetical protein OG21DRAFT_221064 [Imleria badia]